MGHRVSTKIGISEQAQWGFRESVTDETELSVGSGVMDVANEAQQPLVILLCPLGDPSRESANYAKKIEAGHPRNIQEAHQDGRGDL